MRFYALARFIDSSEIKPPDKCMLYRFASITDRNCWVAAGEYRLAVPLEELRRIFPVLRYNHKHIQWCELEIKLRSVRNGFRMTWMTKADYLLIDGRVGTCNYEAIPDTIEGAVEFKNLFRRQINLYKYM